MTIMNIKVTFWRVVFVVIMLLGIYSTYVRYLQGLGAVSNMTDQFPWGLWIGFDCLCGIMLAAGAFCMTGAVYIFHVERLHSIVRPAILTAFLGYVLFIVGLLFDLGRPWYIWHMMVYQNFHSVMLEVGLCVMTYTTVLFLEFLPNVLERFHLQAADPLGQENLSRAGGVGHSALHASPELARLSLPDLPGEDASVLVHASTAVLLLHLSHYLRTGDDDL